jgi:hypothetical protein
LNDLEEYGFSLAELLSKDEDPAKAVEAIKRRDKRYHKKQHKYASNPSFKGINYHFWAIKMKGFS